MKYRIFFSALLLVLSACSDDDTSGPPDASAAADMTADAIPTDLGEVDGGVEEDQGAMVTDMTVLVDAATDMDKANDMSVAPDATTDSGVDAAVDMAIADPYAGRPLGQCVVNDDCPENPNGKLCNRNLPGGSCGFCGNDSVCDDECFNGTCITTCGETEDCPPGLRCTGTGRCAAERCDSGVCPVPLFGCSESDFCTRIDCSNDPNSCPSGTTCVDELCIEDRMLN